MPYLEQKDLQYDIIFQEVQEVNNNIADHQYNQAIEVMFHLSILRLHLHHQVILL